MKYHKSFRYWLVLAAFAIPVSKAKDCVYSVSDGCSCSPFVTDRDDAIQEDYEYDDFSSTVIKSNPRNVDDWVIRHMKQPPEVVRFYRNGWFDKRGGNANCYIHYHANSGKCDGGVYGQFVRKSNSIFGGIRVYSTKDHLKKWCKHLPASTFYSNSSMRTPLECAGKALWCSNIAGQVGMTSTSLLTRSDTSLEKGFKFRTKRETSPRYTIAGGEGLRTILLNTASITPLRSYAVGLSTRSLPLQRTH